MARGAAESNERHSPFWNLAPNRKMPVCLSIRWSDRDCARSPSHTTGRAVFRIRRLNPAALADRKIRWQEKAEAPEELVRQGSLHTTVAGQRPGPARTVRYLQHSSS